MLDSCFGKRGTPERERYEADSEEYIRNYELGEALKAERERQNLTQRQLSEKAGVGESTLSKVENGRGSSMSSLSRIFRSSLRISASVFFIRLWRFSCIPFSSFMRLSYSASSRAPYAEARSNSPMFL